MCLSAHALAVFLNLLAFETIHATPDRIIVRAAVRDAHWVPVADRWCTMAPQIDRMARFTDVAKPR
ncbi:MAG: hypothetical protein AAGG09_10215 [Pseudomonadota bacterium]